MIGKEDFLTVRQVAEKLNITTRAVLLRIKRGEIPGAFQLPGGVTAAYVIPVGVFEAYEARRADGLLKMNESDMS